MQTSIVTATDAPGERPVATLSELTVEGDTFVVVDVDEPLTRDTALALAARLIDAARYLTA